MFQKMLDLDRYVVAKLREFAMQGFHQRYRVAHTIKEVRVAKGEVLRAGSNLLTDVREHNFAIDNPKDAVVDRHNRAVAAKMLAAAARFGVTGDTMLSTWQNQMRVGPERRQAVAVGHLKTQTSQ